MSLPDRQLPERSRHIHTLATRVINPGADDPLCADDRATLKARAIRSDIASERGHRTVNAEEALSYRFPPLSGLLIPSHNTLGEIARYQLRPHKPTVDPDGKIRKYLWPTGSRQNIDVPPPSFATLRDPKTPIIITESALKADAILSAPGSNGYCVLAVAGVYGWRSEGMPLSDHGDIPWRVKQRNTIRHRRRVYLAFDSDAVTNPNVATARWEYGENLRRREADPWYIDVPPAADGSKQGIDDALAAGHRLDELIASAYPAPETMPVIDTMLTWGSPLPLDPTTGPAFPIGALPGTVGQFVAAVAEETQTPPDLPALVALGTISAASGGKFELYYSPTNWYEPGHVMVTPVAESGNNKSGVFRKTVQPLRIWEAERQEADRPRIAEWESRHRRLEKHLAAAESVSRKADGGGVSDGEVVRMAAVEEVVNHLKVRPVLTEVFTDDATPEAVKELLAEQGGAVAVMSAESAYLSNVAGRYSDAPHLDTILNGHAGDLVKVKRKGKPTQHVERASLTLCLMLQPEVIESLGRIEGFRTRGGAARLLPAFPADRIGRRKMVTDAVPDSLAAKWDKMVRRVLDLPRATEPATITLDGDAEAVVTQFRVALEPTIKSEGRDMQAWLAKYAGTVLRIAGLLHIAEHAHPDETKVSADTIRRAVCIGDYFRQHARIMYRLMYGRDGQGEAGELMEVLRSVGEPSISKRDLFQKVRNRAAYPKVDSLNPGLATLEEYGWIQVEERKPSTGRPSTVIHLHPEIGAQNAQNPTSVTADETFEAFERLADAHAQHRAGDNVATSSIVESAQPASLTTGNQVLDEMTDWGTA